MPAILPEKAIRAVISGAVPHVSIDKVQPLPSTRLQRLYGIKLADSSLLILALPPPPMLRQLRFEQLSTGSEAALLKWFGEFGSEKNADAAPTKKSVEPAARVTSAVESDPKDRDSTGESTDESTEEEPDEEPDEEEEDAAAAGHLARLVPTLVAQGPAVNDLGMAYNIIKPTAGTPIIATSPPLTSIERNMVDFQAGQLCRAVSLLVAPSDRFGPALSVLPLPPSSPSKSGGEPLVYTTLRGLDSWSEAFRVLLENILRDGEDMALMLPYATIRKTATRLGHALDGIKTPRLVLVDAWEDTNILIERPQNATESTAKTEDKRDKETSDGKESLKSERDSEEKFTEPEPKSESRNKKAGPSATWNGCSDSIKVTGIREWSNCIFGDPLFTSAFSSEPTLEFRQGFNTPVSDEEDDDGDDENDEVGPTTLIEDRPTMPIRLLLYRCYHATVGVVREFYRPRPDSRAREMAARKMLNEALTGLADVDGSGRMRRRRLSGEMSPAKRPKTDDEDEGD
jgi:hypothetical protein